MHTDMNSMYYLCRLLVLALSQELTLLLLLPLSGELMFFFIGCLDIQRIRLVFIFWSAKN
jgi:hypothetical protein